MSRHCSYHATYSTVLRSHIGNSGVPLHDAAFGGMNVRVADYARFAPRAVGSCTQGAGGPDRLPACKSRNDRDRRIIDKAMWLAVELETIARQYYLTLAIGGRCC